ncbi:hypothetical protein DVH05_022488 [Phytophthora capsici]|nr:hypothetical protein DVH05_022488 [Phytophthora capsici]
MKLVPKSALYNVHARSSLTSNLNYPIEICVLRIEEYDRYYRLDGIDYYDETEFEKVLQIIEMLDVSRRNKCLF